MDISSERVTIQQLAQRLELHHSTVSRALSGHPKIAAETKRRVRALAEALDYRPDPYLAGLSAYQRRRQAAHFTGTLAWVTNWPTRDGWRSNHAFPQYFEGARRRAEALGYKVEEFWIREQGRSTGAALRVLQARGVQGLLLVPQPESHTRLEADLSRFSAVTFGFTLESPALHTVTSHSYRTMIALLEKLVELGYRRPGLAASAFHEERVNRMWSAAFWAFEARRGKRRGVVPPLTMGAPTAAELQAWVRKHRPDVVIITDLVDMRTWLEEGGWKIPDEIGLVPTITSDNSWFSGMNENGPVIGAAAVDLLVSMLHRNERGAPAHPQRVMIDASWVDGYSVRKADN
ncbi:LacI family transcriptional regulator [Opitutaceae bacterium TAV4]|nr:LacI family transcriptional regulator [Opitutaceae bacterium TAV4]RRJ99490.1 LacI family transcriptional regulator [Opitutaceae bacterium TAV3]